MIKTDMPLRLSAPTNQPSASPSETYCRPIFGHLDTTPLSINLLRSFATIPSNLRGIMSQDSINTVAAKSCLECRRRKIKCDKSIPCSYCVKVKIKCRYPASNSVSNKDRNSSSSNEVLSARINGIENTLHSFEHSISQIWDLLQQNHPPARSGGNCCQSCDTLVVNDQTLSVERTNQVCFTIQVSICFILTRQ
jgi:hypothetical protein